MDELGIRPGVVLTEIHGVHLLVADREARGHCPYIRRINGPGALVWEGILSGISREEVVCRIRQEYEVPEGTDPEADADCFVEVLKQDNYIVCGEGSHEI